MYQHGAFKKTEFTRKQINALYQASKTGQIAIEDWVIEEWYKLADYYGYDDNHNVEHLEVKILPIIQAFFAKKDELQNMIQSYTNERYEQLGIHAQKEINKRRKKKEDQRDVQK